MQIAKKRLFRASFLGVTIKCGADIIDSHSEETNIVVYYLPWKLRPGKNLSLLVERCIQLPLSGSSLLVIAVLGPEILRSPWFQSLCQKIFSFEPSCCRELLPSE